MIRALLPILLAIASPAAAAQGEPVRIDVARDGDTFVAEFDLPRDAPAWGFFRSSPAAKDEKSWRLQSWQVLSPGVRLERRGKFDALVGEAGRPVPRKIRVRLTPFTGDLVSNYVPALRLGGNSVALFDGHFALFSVADPATLDTLPLAGDPARVVDTGFAVRFRGRALRLMGDVEGYRAGRSEGTYGLFEVPRAVVSNGVATVIDSDLPKWIADDLATTTPKVIETLTAGLGPSGVTEPTILAAWEGADRKGASYNGGTLKGLVLMRFEGESALRPLPALADLAHWFIAHEASHFWLGHTVRYGTPRDSWVLEGGAELLAMRTVQKLNPRFDPRTKLNEALRDCSELADEPVATALERNEPRANYACGAVFALVAEKASGGDFFGFIRRLVDANRADGVLTSDEWLAALTKAAGGPDSARRIRSLAEKGSTDPKADLAALLRASGIAYAMDAKGIPQLP